MKGFISLAGESRRFVFQGVVGDAAGGVYAFDGKTGATIWTQRGVHEGGVLAVAIHPNRPVFATAGQDGRGLVWSAAEGRVRLAIEVGNGWVENVAWSRRHAARRSGMSCSNCYRARLRPPRYAPGLGISGWRRRCVVTWARWTRRSDRSCTGGRCSRRLVLAARWTCACCARRSGWRDGLGSEELVKHDRNGMVRSGIQQTKKARP